MIEYTEFLATKAVRPAPVGIQNVKGLPKALKPFQKDIVLWALSQGRCAIFAGTGLGKTVQQLAWADQMVKATGKSCLILTPLAVAQQTVAEAAKFGIKGVAYAADQSGVTGRIVVTNYDRVAKFDMDQFGSAVLDESSIIKAHDSKTRAQLTELCAGIPYRLCCTATPAPNDYVELGNHAEFLGILTAKEMLATWFVHDGSIRATNAQNKNSKPIADWRLKGHAEQDFWRWVATWAVVIRHPRDIGYEEPGYDLPPLVKHQITVAVAHEANLDTGTLFAMEANTLQERRAAARASIAARVAAAAKIIASDPDGPWLIWCNLNDEADGLKSAIDGVTEVRGPDDPEDKAKRLLGFADGSVQRLLSKPSIAGWGLNFQRCNRMIFIGLNDSFEMLYQAVRRCWRFGQTESVNVYLIAADTEGAVVANLEEKERAAEYMADQMAVHMKDLTKRNLKGAAKREFATHGTKMELPAWM
jgi:hypothetical protein